MTVSDVAMLVIAVIAGAAALLVVTARNVVHAALFLVVALLGVAGTFLILGAEFLAWAQVLVYVGAVIVLILFGLMLTRAPIGPIAQHNENRKLAVGIAVGLFAFLVTVIMMSFPTTGIPLEVVSAGALGEVLYIHWALPFMALGFLLTVALIGSIILARQEEGEGPAPDEALPTLRRGDTEPSPSDATTTPGVVEPAQEVTNR